MYFVKDWIDEAALKRRRTRNLIRLKGRLALGVLIICLAMAGGAIASELAPNVKPPVPTPDLSRSFIHVEVIHFTPVSPGVPTPTLTP